MTATTSDTCNLLAMVASPIRLKALRYLSRSGEPGLTDIAGAIGEPSGQVVSYQLDLLRHAGLVEAQKDEDGLRYRITAGGRRLLQGVAVVEGGAA